MTETIAVLKELLDKVNKLRRESVTINAQWSDTERKGAWEFAQGLESAYWLIAQTIEAQERCEQIRRDCGAGTPAPTRSVSEEFEYVHARIKYLFDRVQALEDKAHHD